MLIDNECTAECERMPECATCHRTKQPRGRSAPLDSYYCDYGCPGYGEEPQPGHLWPGELARERETAAKEAK